MTVMKDRFHDLRYILNFTGVRPVAYIVGLQLAEFALCLIPVILSVFVGIILDLDTFKYHWGEIIFAMGSFSLPYINLNFLFAWPIAWCIGRSQKGIDEVFKYVILPNMLLYALGLYLTLHDGDDVDSPFNYIFLFSGLSKTLRTLTLETVDGKDTTHKPLFGDIWKWCVTMIAQGVLFLIINILLDWWKQVSYKGSDNKIETTMRN